jgi:HAD superfamily hydrolase (TIGR01509 family)
VTSRALAPVDAVIFDMDGVLADSEPLNFEALRLFLAGHGVQYTTAENDEFIGVTDREHLGILRERYRLAPDLDRLMGDYTGRLLALIPGGTVPMPGVPEVPRRLADAGYGLAVASSATRAVLEARLQALGVLPLFRAVVSGAEVPQGKPEPDVFLEAARRLAVTPARCLVVEDSRNGLRAARAAGMMCAVVPCQATLGQDLTGADLRLGELSDLLGALGVDGQG